METIEEELTDLSSSAAVATRIEYLRKTRFLQFASQSLVQRLAEAMEIVEAPAGSNIVKKGDHGDTMYFVVDGSVRVHDESVDLAKLGKGAMFGEIAALSTQPRTASITADKDSLLYSVSQQSLYSVLEEQPDAARSIIQGLCDKESQFVKEMIETAVKTKIMERELEIGRRIQQGFLPRNKLEINGWDIESYFKAAREVAGDFFDYFEIKSLNRIAVVIGDVCDKGVGAALFMSLFRSLIRSSALSYDYADWNNNKDVGMSLPSESDLLLKTINQVNQYVATTHAQDSMFATLFIALFDPHSGRFSYINAGHESPCLITPNNGITQLNVTGPVIGLFDQAQYRVESGQLNEGELLIGFTDGIPEAKNLNNEEFGEHRLLQALESAPRSSAAVISSLIKATQEFVGVAKQSDDITALAIGRNETRHGQL